MPFWLLKRKLTSRGYWNEAGGADGGAGAGGSGSEGGAGDPPANPNPPADPPADPNKDKNPDDTILKDLMKQKKRNKELDAELSTLKENLAKYSDINLDEVRTLLDERKNSETKKLEEQGQWELLKKQMAEEHSKSVNAAIERANQLQAELDARSKVINELTLGQSFATSNFILNDMTLSPEKTRIIYGSHFDLEDGKIVAYNKPKGSADRAPLVNASGDNLSFEDALKSIVESDPDKDRLIRSKAKAGSGSGTTNKQIGLTQKPELKGVDRIAASLGAKK